MLELEEEELSLLKVLVREWDESGPPGFLETALLPEGYEIVKAR